VILVHRLRDSVCGSKRDKENFPLRFLFQDDVDLIAYLTMDYPNLVLRRRGIDFILMVCIVVNVIYNGFFIY
jgi:hypothetical protein